MIKVKNDKKNYSLYRHHAWAGGLMLAVVIAVKSVLQASFPDIIFLPMLALLILYILIALFFTYKYRTDLLSKDTSVSPTIDVDLEKEKLKIEKKKTKAQVKAQKKQKK